ncbi:hypothetical protein MOO45_03570 [Bombilactobacillus folatiphilus]|uniref:Uncharacterized protein n=1 Tax=Bombilactobacillus folatiphilus TaxID=2923362 RepID=A0ABY4PAV7_9LACO|nr:hypothetical protein [Bombilactobacillus folatiphilus]UQS82732.1 hypothetical protein MOO45_03570 [Bombilactobacillus folatiphilus]
MTLGVTLFSSVLWINTNKTITKANDSAFTGVQSQGETSDNNVTGNSNMDSSKIAAKSSLQLNIQTARNQVNSFSLPTEQTASLQQKLQDIDTQFTNQIDQAQVNADLINIQGTAQAQIQTVVQQAQSLQSSQSNNSVNAQVTGTNEGSVDDNNDQPVSTTPPTSDNEANTTNETTDNNTDQEAIPTQPTTTTTTNSEDNQAVATADTKPQIANQALVINGNVAEVDNDADFYKVLSDSSYDNIDTIVLTNNITLLLIKSLDIDVDSDRPMTIKSEDGQRYYLDMRAF